MNNALDTVWTRNTLFSPDATQILDTKKQPQPSSDKG